MAEIQPETRVFKLNLESSDFRKLQFIHAEPSPRSRHSRQQQQLQSCLLVVGPNAFAAVYNFKLQCIRAGFVVLREPEKEVFCEVFCWYQWDPAMQWLYCAQFESSQTVIQSSHSGHNSLLLHCYSFNQLKPDLVLTIALPLPYSVRYYQRGETYYTSPLALTLPIQEINMQVLYMRKGLWCACLQHGNGVECRGDLSEDSSENSDFPEAGKLDYTVFIFNSGYMLQMQVPLPMPVVEPLNIHFMVISGFVVAYIPNFLLHILNVGPNTDPCHHLAFGPNQSPSFLISPQASDDTTFMGEIFMSSAVATVMQTRNIATVIDHRTSEHYEISINAAAFLQLFKTTESIEMMEDLLHLTIVALRHHGMALSMVEHVCQSPMGLGNHRIFSEFLVSFAFANTVLELRRYVRKQLPLTTSPTFYGKVFKNSERVTFAMLRLNPIREFIDQLLVLSDQRLVRPSPDDLLHHEVGDKPFEELCYFAVTSQPSRARINILQELESQDKHSLLSSRPLPPSLGNSLTTRSKKQHKHDTSADSTLSRSTILNRLSQLTRSSFQRAGTNSQSDDIHGNVLPFLNPDTDHIEGLLDEKEILIGVISKLISQGLQQRSKNIVVFNVRAYCSELEKHSCSLLRLIWDSLGFKIDSSPTAQSIYRQSTPLEEILFECLEAYQLAHQEIGFPTPPGFYTLFASLGFICLSDTLFLQYLRNGVFVPTEAFIELLLQDTPSENKRENVVYEVICHANPRLAASALQQWKHPNIKTLSERSITSDRRV